MKCQNCATENKDDEMFCFLCGAKLEKEGAEKETAKNDIKVSETANGFSGSESLSASTKTAPGNFTQKEKKQKKAKNESELKQKRIPVGIILGIIIGLAVIVTGILLIVLIIVMGNNDKTGSNDNGIKNEEPSYNDYGGESYEKCIDIFIDIETEEYFTDNSSPVALGINGISINELMFEEDEDEEDIPQGVFIASMCPHGACALVGIMEGDIIVALDGITVEDADDLMELKRYYMAGDNAVVGVFRYDEEIDYWEYLEFTIIMQDVDKDYVAG